MPVRIPIFTMLLLAYLCSGAIAQTSEHYQLRRATFAGGGGSGMSESYQLHRAALTTGVEGRHLSSEHYQVGSILGIAPTTRPVTVRIPDASGYRGQTASVAIEVDAPDSITAIDLTVAYDATLLTPGVAQTAELTQAWSLSSSAPQPGTLNVSLAHSSPLTVPGIVVQIPFTVASDAPAGATSPLTLSVASLNEGRTPSRKVSGNFSILAALKGDVSGDGKVTDEDGVLVLRLLVGLVDRNDYPNLTPEVGDITGDGTISAVDAARIFQSIGD